MDTNILIYFLLGLSLWAILTLAICITLINYLFKKDKEEYAFLVYPGWLFLNMIIVLIYLIE